MKDKHRITLAVAAAVLIVSVVVATIVSPSWLLALLGVLQIAALVLLLDTRRVLSARVLMTVRNFEARLNKRWGSGGAGRNVSGGKPAASSQVAAGSGAPSSVSREQEVRLIRGSLVFDQEWYERQVAGTFASIDRAITHYLERGRRAGFSPHPLFSPAWLFPASWSNAEQDPLVSYLKNRDGLWEKSTSPFFDPAYLPEAFPGDEFGPLTAFLRDRGADTPLPYDDVSLARTGVTLEQIREFLFRKSTEWRHQEQLLSPTRGSGEPPAETPELIHARDEFLARTDELPLVSVILPTWNRAGQLRTAIDSIVQQSYAKWELIVADDGSTDDTQLVLAAAAGRDPRIIPLALSHRGVSAARNAALARATGQYVAFLDSDKQWEPDFLLSMTAFLEQGGHGAGYSVVQVSFKGKALYRATPATPESLLIANSIDQTAIVARRDLVERAGGFDEGLLRAVDYDLILSLSRLTELVQVPYLGVSYSEDDQDPNRISEAESVAWNFYVRDRRRWADADLPEVTPGLVSIVVDGSRSAADVRATLINLRDHMGDVEAEIILLLASHSWSLLQTMALAEFSKLNVRVLPLVGVNDRPALRINHALRVARGEYVYITTAHLLHTQGTVAELLDVLRSSDAAVIHPMVLNKRRLIEDAGVVYAPDGRDPVGLLGGLPSDWGNFELPLLPVPAATFPLLMRTSTMRKIGGVNTKLRQLWLDVDMSQSAARVEAMPVVVHTDSAVQMTAPSSFAPHAGAEHDVRMFASLWPQTPHGSEAAIAAAGVHAIFEGFTARSIPADPERWGRATWRTALERWTDAVRDRPAAPLQWSIKTAAPADERARSWGDFHFATSLAAALRSLGQRASVDYGPNVDRASANADQVVLNLRGLKSVPLPVGATSLIWVISHPEQVTAQELAAYDLRYAASASYPRTVAEQWGLDMRPLLQCTDPDRFYIDDVIVPEVQGKLLMVGNSRKQYRPAAFETANAGLPVAIYGTNWEEYVDASYIAGAYVPNEELRRYYRSAEWALNDHWPDMRDQGFVSNRIFDVLASGGRLLTDDVDGLDGLFPKSVLPSGIATFTAPSDLLATVEAGPAKFYSEESLKAASEYVRSEHSFEARARVMLEDVERHRAQSRGA